MFPGALAAISVEAMVKNSKRAASRKASGGKRTGKRRQGSPTSLEGTEDEVSLVLDVPLLGVTFIVLALSFWGQDQVSACFQLFDCS